MSHVFYAVNGEGRGHATRARTVVERLRTHHRVTIFTHALGYRLLSPLYEDTPVAVIEIDGPEFQYENDRLSYWATAKHVVPKLWNLSRTVRKYVRYFEELKPDLLITDFEAYMPRAARLVGVPFISLDHQHFLRTADLGPLPMELKAYAAFMSPFVKIYHRGARETLVSSFYRPPTRRGMEHARHVGVLLRPEVLNAKTEWGDHLIAYLRREHCTGPLKALIRSQSKVTVYGLGERPPLGNVSFKPVDPFTFVEDLATSRGLISTAGNQLVGEALYLQKPVFAIPEEGNFEQHINAWFLRDSGCGVTAPVEKFTREAVWRFEARSGQLRKRIHPMRHVGNDEVFGVIEKYLDTPDQYSAVREQSYSLQPASTLH